MSEPDSTVPAVRVSDAERDAVLDQLRDAAGEGRLGLEELAERIEGALAAVTARTARAAGGSRHLLPPARPWCGCAPTRSWRAPT